MVTMSGLEILKRAKQVNLKKDKYWGCILGRRGSGKSTLAGTLPGKTAILAPYMKEAGTGSAETLAKKLRNSVDVYYFEDPLVDGKNTPSLLTYIRAFGETDEYDNIYLDSFTAVSNMLHDSKDVVISIKKEVWSGFRYLGYLQTRILNSLRSLTSDTVITYTNDSINSEIGTTKKFLNKKKKNVFYTIAVEEKISENGGIQELKLDVKGKVTVSEVINTCPIILGCYNIDTERSLITTGYKKYPCRIDLLLDGEDNPKVISPPNLKSVFDLIEGKK